MIKVYNNEFDIANGLDNFFEKIDFYLSKPQKKIIPHIIFAMINAENITTHDISKIFIDNSFLTNQESIEKKLWRFFNNKKFNGIDLFNASIRYIISNVKHLKHDKVIVVMDHMFMKNNFVTIMFTLKIGKQSIPIYFKCDKTKSNRHHEIDEITKKIYFQKKYYFISLMKKLTYYLFLILK